MEHQQPSWEETFFRDLYNWAERSRDPRTKISAFLIDWDKKIPYGHAYNGFPRKFEDSSKRWEKPTKYDYVIHGEENALLNCSRYGLKTDGATLITQGLPCNFCAKSICNAGIKEVLIHEQWRKYEQGFSWDKWLDSQKKSLEMFNELGIVVRVFDKYLGVNGYLDGNVIKI